MQFIIALMIIATWITHVVVSMQAWMLLIIGAIIFPVGAIHGVMVWFGAGFF